jgi:Fe-S-cluster containining protein
MGIFLSQDKCVTFGEFVASDPLIDPLEIGGHIVPGIWRYMLPYDFQNLQFPKEKAATCSDCPRILTDDYRPDYRCCTYIPKVPNFLLGLAYKHDSRARKSIAKVRDEGWFLPEGLQESARMHADFVIQVGKEQFGKTSTTLCPFLSTSNGFCQIYHYRNSVCSSFFCTNDHGDAGTKFWEEVTTLVMQVELALCQWSLEKIGFDYKAYTKRFDHFAKDIDSTFNKGNRHWKKEVNRQLWGDAYGEEIEIFIACAEAVDQERENLWTIANKVQVVESEEFDRATTNMVPKKYREDDESDEEQEFLAPKSIYRDLEKAHRKMWQIPHYKLRLSPKVVIEKNPLDDKESTKFKHQPFVVNLMERKNSNSYEWRGFYPKPIVSALKLFENPRSPSFDVLQEIEKITSIPGKEFVSEWCGKNILVKAKS